MQFSSLSFLLSIFLWKNSPSKYFQNSRKNNDMRELLCDCNFAKKRLKILISQIATQITLIWQTNSLKLVWYKTYLAQYMIYDLNVYAAIEQFKDFNTLQSAIQCISSKPLQWIPRANLRTNSRTSYSSKSSDTSFSYTWFSLSSRSSFTLLKPRPAFCRILLWVDFFLS